MEHLITAVAEGSPAFKNGLRPGDTLLSINQEELIDQIDYQALSSKRHLVMHIRKQDGRDWNVELVKGAGVPLGLSFGESMVTRPRICKNKCVFCFIDQMPPACRKTLYVKDDDWRMSLMMGNFITLTNVDDDEFARILKRKVSPLYISVHATDPEVRVQMMKNPQAHKIMDRLKALKEHNIKFHCQIVLCPGINDGAVLEKTLEDLTSLAPCALSAALVPVGLTKYREHLAKLDAFNKSTADDVLAICDRWQCKCLDALGTRFVFPADEMLCIAGKDIPEEDYYEGYPQIENGVGLMRKFLTSLIKSHQESRSTAKPRRVLIPCGTSISSYMQNWMDAYAPAGVDVTVVPILNRFFGKTVTVTGLLTGQDILDQLDISQADEVLLCAVTLRAEGDLFLDDMTIDAFREALHIPVHVVHNSGDALYTALLGKREE